MRDRVNKYGLQVDKLLFDFVNDKVLPGTDLEVESFWEKFERAYPTTKLKM